MRYLLLVILSLNFALYSQSHKISTFNLKYENLEDGIHKWQNRKENVVNFIKIEQMDVIGMQEVLYSQIEYLENNLPNYQRLGVGRDDGKTKGEYSPIFFKKERYELVDSNTFWLSPNQNQAGKGWDAAYIRICTWAKLLDKKKKETILFLNTHLDNEGEQARIKSIDLIMDVIKDMHHKGGTVLMGDFNLEPDNELIHKVIKFGFTDSYEAPLKFGPKGTFNGFEINETHNRRIDYIFLKNFTPISYVVNSMIIDKSFLSDHFPVTVKIK